MKISRMNMLTVHSGWKIELNMKNFQKTKSTKKTINDSKLTTRQIQSKYNVSYSVLNRIKRCDKSLVLHLKRRKLVILKENQNLGVINCIKEYVYKIENAITAKDVTSHVNYILKINYSIKYIMRIMKNQVKLGFKKVKSRPINIDFDRIYWIRNLFAIKY